MIGGIIQTLFERVLSNNGHLQMNIVTLEENNELQYTVTIDHWPWDNHKNSIEFCFYISNQNTNDLQFETSNKVWIDTTDNNIGICHHFHFNDTLIGIGHVYYSDNRYTETTQTVEYEHDSTIMESTQIFNVSRKVSFFSPQTHQQMIWLFGVSIVIGLVICLFIFIVCYLIYKGFFDDSPSRSLMRRKKSKTTMMNKKRVTFTNNPTTSSSSPACSPKKSKSLRINVTCATPKKKSTRNLSPIVESINGDGTKEYSKTNSCDATCIVHTDDNSNMTPILIPLSVGTPTVHSANDTECEDSMVQYIITCSNGNTATPVTYYDNDAKLDDHIQETVAIAKSKIVNIMNM